MKSMGLEPRQGFGSRGDGVSSSVITRIVAGHLAGLPKAIGLSLLAGVFGMTVQELGLADKEGGLRRMRSMLPLRPSGDAGHARAGAGQPARRKEARPPLQWRKRDIARADRKMTTGTEGTVFPRTVMQASLTAESEVAAGAGRCREPRPYRARQDADRPGLRVTRPCSGCVAAPLAARGSPRPPPGRPRATEAVSTHPQAFRRPPRPRPAAP